LALRRRTRRATNQMTNPISASSTSGTSTAITTPRQLGVLGSPPARKAARPTSRTREPPGSSIPPPNLFRTESSANLAVAA
jgi:hypothetical protein